MIFTILFCSCEEEEANVQDIFYINHTGLYLDSILWRASQIYIDDRAYNIEMYDTVEFLNMKNLYHNFDVYVYSEGEIFSYGFWLPNSLKDVDPSNTAFEQIPYGSYYFELLVADTINKYNAMH